jgi:hypothetical protein
MDTLVSFTQVPEFINHSNQSLDYSTQSRNKSEIILPPQDNYLVTLKFSVKLELPNIVDWVKID